MLPLAAGFEVFFAPFVVMLMIGAVFGSQLLARRWLFWGSRLFFSPEQFAAELAGELGLEARVVPAEPGDWSRTVRALERVRVAGVLEGGRAARVHFAPRSSFPKSNRPPMQAVLTVDAGSAPPIRISRESLLHKLASFFVREEQSSVHTGDGAFDAKFVVKAGDEPRARRALERDVRDLVRLAFERHEVQELVFENGELQALVTLSPAGLPLSRVAGKGGVATPTRELLGILDRIARAFDRVSVDVRVLGGSRRALLGLEGHPRCAYCHDQVSGDEPDLVACNHCATVCHDGCWREHGSCPVLGCSGGSPERAADGGAREPASTA